MRRADFEAIIKGPAAWVIHSDKKQALGDESLLELGGEHPPWIADLESAPLAHAHLEGVQLSGGDLRNADLDGAYLSGASLEGAQMTCAYLGTADLRDAQLSHANLAGADLRGADIREANLTGANLTGAFLGGARLSSARLRGARLDGAFLGGAHLDDSDLTGASLGAAYLGEVDLRGADLTDARLQAANLFRVRLDGATLTDARFGRTALVDMDAGPLCEAHVEHVEPSHVDARTVMRSFKYPGFKALMAACGVPWIFVEYLVDCAKAVAADDLGALMQSTFISYGQPDDAFARQLYESLTSRRITVFYFPETARWGERLGNEVRKQINSHDRVILICSEHSLNRPGVLNEIQETFDREAREGGASRLLPIALDDYLFDPNGLESVDPDLAVSIRARIVADFRKASTDPTEYDKALDRLIDVLKKTKP